MVAVLTIFHFPLSILHLTWVEGYFRSTFRSRANEIRLLSERLALCPAAHWSRYDLAASRSWCTTNDVDGLVVTFENAAIGDDPTKIASVQMELFPRTSEVALRYDLANVGDATYTAGLVVNGTNNLVEVGAGTREVVFQRVHPDDWDMDGIPNGMDADPRVAATNAGWNQSDAWAMLAFPSNAAEIVTMGYAAWAMARAADPNRRLVGLRVSSASGAWPLLLTFGDVQVMCDGKQEIVFAIDCGAHYPFSISDGGKLEFVTLHADVDDVLSCFAYGYPYERWAGDVVAHLDSPSSGWIGRTAEVTVDGLDGAHFFPCDSTTVTAVVTNIHEDAFVDCTWIGGEGISFSDNHSLSTTIYWNSTNGVAWATNYVDLVTTYEGGYAITNRHGITVGPQTEPTTDFSVDCQEVFFLNDADFLEPGNCSTNRPERIRPVTLRLVGTRGMGGYMSIVNEGAAHAVLFQVENGVTNRIDSSTRIHIEVGSDSFARESVKTVYMSCPVLGRGILRATWTPDEGASLSDEVDYQVIEPIRKLVNTGRYNGNGPIMNPSRLVWGTNAVLKVSVNLAPGDTFSTTNEIFSRISGPGRVVSQWRTGNDWYAVVEATSDTGDFVVSARFNDDEIQPCFRIPILKERTIHVRAFAVKPASELLSPGWEDGEIIKRFDMANVVFAQAGIRFVLDEIRTNNVGTVDDWCLKPIVRKVVDGQMTYRLSEQVLRLLNTYTSNDCLKVFFTGVIREDGVGAFTIPLKYPCQGIFMSMFSTDLTLPHELGHALGLEDCYSSIERVGQKTVEMDKSANPVDRSVFPNNQNDWGAERGRGFYERCDSRKNIVDSLIMLGVTSMSEEPIPKMDIPDKSVLSLRHSATNEVDLVESKVGTQFIETSDHKVYTHENESN